MAITISRGFRRLSVFVAMLGSIAGLVFLLFEPGDISTVPLTGWLILLGLFVVIPTIVTLTLGWVVAGFQKTPSN